MVDFWHQMIVDQETRAVCKVQALLVVHVFSMQNKKRLVDRSWLSHILYNQSDTQGVKESNLATEYSESI